MLRILFIFTISLFSLWAKDVKLGTTPALSPDATMMTFSWLGDLWQVPTEGGQARRLTNHPAEDYRPFYSKDGKSLLFSSHRRGQFHSYIMPVNGGMPVARTEHTVGSTPVGFWPTDNKDIISRAWREGSGNNKSRFYRVDEKGSEKLLFDTYAAEVSVSSNGKQVLLVREGQKFYRKGYRGSQSAQIWLYNLETKEYQKILHEDYSAMSPIWKNDMSGFYFLGDQLGVMNVYEYDFVSKKPRQMTSFKENAVMLPSLSADGSMLVFRHLFDFYRLSLKTASTPEKITITVEEDLAQKEHKKRKYDRVWNSDVEGGLAFGEKGKAILFTTGGDTWLMEAGKQKPVSISSSSDYHDTEVLFSADEKIAYIVRDHGDTTALWSLKRKDEKLTWAESKNFSLEKLTDDFSAMGYVQRSLDGKKLSFIRNRGELCIYDFATKKITVIYKGGYNPWATWSPDGKYLVAQIRNSSENSDIWLLSIDGKVKYNLSRHPSWNWGARWSPDGRVIAWCGKLYDGSFRMYYVYLDQRDGQRTSEDWAEIKDPKSNFNIDFSDLHDRVVELKNSGQQPEGLFWSYDSKALGFTSTIKGRRATYKYYFPHPQRADKITNRTGTQTEWTKEGIFWLHDYLPAKLNKSFHFNAYQRLDLKKYRQLLFRMIWRELKVNFHDENMNGVDWQKMLPKYHEMAGDCLDDSRFSRLVEMLNGELNASHLGWTDKHKRYSENEWNEVTQHTGILTDDTSGVVKVVRAVFGTPAARLKYDLKAGEIIEKVDGEKVFTKGDFTKACTKLAGEKVELTILGLDKKTRTISFKLMTYDTLWSKMDNEGLRNARRYVEKASNGRLGYLHIKAMTTKHLRKFEQEVYSRSFGKDGLVIDVRNNPGGFIADRLLSILCHPSHARTRPRNGEISYPHGYLPKVTYHKPIIVLCNQNSTSNAEIFSHAIKTLKRGKVVGVPTAGLVISMPKVEILDAGTLAVPDRTWWPNGDKIDMDRQGAVPNVVIWPVAGDQEKGIDRQLDKAIELLLEEVK